MKKACVVVLFFLLFLFSKECLAETSNLDIVRLGIGSGVFTSFVRTDGGGSFNLYARFERYTPFELEMSYFIARGGIEIILLIDIIRTRNVNWHLFDIGLYFPMNTRLFSNIDLEREFDIVVGTGLDIPIPRRRNFVITLNLRFYVPDPDRIGAYASGRGAEAARGIGDHFTMEAMEDLDAFIDEEYDSVIHEYRDSFRDVFRDVGVSMIFMVGFKYYFN